MVGRVALGLMVVFAIACSSSPPEDISYPPLPDRNATEPGDASPDARAGMLNAIDAATLAPEESTEMPVVPPSDASVGSPGSPSDASFDAPIFVVDAGVGADAAPMDGGACDATEVEPNDLAPNQLPYGKTCGSLVAQEQDRFLFRPMQKVKLSFASSSPFTVVYVGDYSDTFQKQVKAGQSIEVGPSNDAWYAIVAGPQAANYSVHIELVP